MPLVCDDFFNSTCFKMLYWIVVFTSLSGLLIYRKELLFSSESHIIDKALFALWAIILFYPLVSEISILGVSMKKELLQLKEEVTSELRDIRLSLNNIAVLSANQRQQIVFQGYPRPSSDTALDRTEQTLQSFLDQIGVATQDDLRTRLDTFQIPEDMRADDRTNFMFNIRYALEREVRRIADSYMIVPKRRSVIQLLTYLVNQQVIEKEIFQSFREVYAITSFAVHGEEVTEKQVNFVGDVAYGLLNYLKNI